MIGTAQQCAELDFTATNWSTGRLKMRFSDDHIRMIREMFPECPKSDFDRFLFNAERLELDPLLGQIQLISRRYKDKQEKWHISFQTLLGRDAYRILADRLWSLMDLRPSPSSGRTDG